MDGKTLYGEAGSITITNPYEVHANPLADPGIKLDFDTVYIPQEVMKYLFGGKNVTFHQRKIEDRNTGKWFEILKQSLAIRHTENIRVALNGFADALYPFAVEKEGEYSELAPASLNDAVDFIHANITANLSLEEIARVVNCNKYGFAKKFRVSTGMSPMHYVLMKKIFSGKQQITAHSRLTQIAYDYGLTFPGRLSVL